jgi:hypothetical protein
VDGVSPREVIAWILLSFVVGLAVGAYVLGSGPGSDAPSWPDELGDPDQDDATDSAATVASAQADPMREALAKALRLVTTSSSGYDEPGADVPDEWYGAPKRLFGRVTAVETGPDRAVLVDLAEFYTGELAYRMADADGVEIAYEPVYVRDRFTHVQRFAVTSDAVVVVQNTSFVRSEEFGLHGTDVYPVGFEEWAQAFDSAGPEDESLSTDYYWIVLGVDGVECIIQQYFS